MGTSIGFQVVFEATGSGFQVGVTRWVVLT